MKKIFKLLLWLLVLILIIVFVGGFIFLKTFDLNKYKSFAENLVYEQTGRKLSLDGEAGLKISLIPTVVLRDVSLSNAPWAEPESMIEVKSVEVSMDVLPLLKKQLVINTIDLVNPKVNLAINKEGVPNWDFVPVNASNKQNVAKSGAGDKSSVSAAKTAAALGIVAKHLQIEKGVIVYNDLQSGNVSNVKINSLNLLSAGMDDNINLDFAVEYNGEVISGKAQVGSINSVLQNYSDFPVKADVKAFGVTVQADLKANNLLQDVSFLGNLKVSNPSGNFNAPNIKLDTDVSGSLKEIKAVINQLNVAGNVVKGMATVDLEQAKPFIDVNLSSNLINLQTLTMPVKTSFVLPLMPSAYAASFVPDTTVDLKALNSVNAKAKLDVGQLIIDDNFSVENLNLSAVLKDGVLNLKPIKLQTGGGTINAEASINVNGNVFDVDLTGKNIVLQNMLKQLALSDNSSFGIKSGGDTNVRIKLSGKGATVRKMVESLNGQVIAVVGESKIQTGSLKFLSGNFITQILNSLNLKTAQDMSLKCAVVRSDIAGGKAQFPKGIVFNAKQMVIVGDGTLNLENDKLNFMLHPFNNRLTDTNIAQAITSLLKISGTVQNPKITLDNSSVIKNVVGVAAAGPAYLGSQVLLDGDTSPCYTALQKTEYQNMFSAPSGAKATGQGIYQGTNELINDSVELLTDKAKDVLKMFKKK